MGDYYQMLGQWLPQGDFVDQSQTENDYMTWTSTTTTMMEDMRKRQEEKFPSFIKTVVQLLEDNGIPSNTVAFINAIDMKTPRFDKDAVLFLEEYSAEVKERIIGLIQTQYIKFVEDSLGKFMSMYATLLGQMQQQQISRQTVQQQLGMAPIQTTWSSSTSGLTIAPSTSTDTIVGTLTTPVTVSTPCTISLTYSDGEGE